MGLIVAVLIMAVLLKPVMNGIAWYNTRKGWGRPVPFHWTCLVSAWRYREYLQRRGL